jgi:hypothetical protein
MYMCMIVGLIALDEVEEAVTGDNVRGYCLIMPNIDRVSSALVNPFITNEIRRLIVCKLSAMTAVEQHLFTCENPLSDRFNRVSS